MKPKLNPEWNTVPTCSGCKRKMKLNVGMSTPTTRSYICGCAGRVNYVNIHQMQTGSQDKD